MKTREKLSLLLAAILAAGALPLAGQTLTTLHTFSASSTTTNSDGEEPRSDLVLSGNTLYGTAPVGGSNGYGTLFSVNVSGSNFTLLHTFTGGSDGSSPNKDLVLSANTLYGLVGRGTNLVGLGSVFSVETNGSNFTTLYTFSASSDGSLGQPNGGLALDSGTLYGTAYQGGIDGWGTIFSIATNNTNFTLLHQFVSASDGANPLGTLVVSGGMLYGTTRNGGSNGPYGTVFSIPTNGGALTVLHAFAGTPNADGSNPDAGLILLSNMLYGTTALGGTNGHGTVFSVSTDGSVYSELHAFTGVGEIPEDVLILQGNTLYGTTLGDGTTSTGTIFSINTDGTSFTLLHTFSMINNSQGDTNSDGADPYDSVIMAGNVLYGTTSLGGSTGQGTVFSLVIAPEITSISATGPNLLLQAINGVAGNTYTLRASTNLLLPLYQWTPVATNFLTTGGNFIVTATNVVSAGVGQEFFVLETQ